MLWPRSYAPGAPPFASPCLHFNSTAALAESGKVVLLDTKLPVRQAFHALHDQGVTSAPLWDSTSHTMVGMISASGERRWRSLTVRARHAVRRCPFHGLYDGSLFACRMMLTFFAP